MQVASDCITHLSHDNVTTALCVQHLHGIACSQLRTTGSVGYKTTVVVQMLIISSLKVLHTWCCVYCQLWLIVIFLV